MTLWHTSYDLRLTAAGLTAAAVAKKLRLEGEYAELDVVGLGLMSRDTSG